MNQTYPNILKLNWERRTPSANLSQYEIERAVADYDPSNILVKKENGKWRISAVLDWEFADSSSYYMDIGLMLRYAHKLPSFFQKSFLQGIKDSNPSLLDSDWEIRAKLIDILCLLSLCDSQSSDKRPLMMADIRELLVHTLSKLS